MNRILRNKRSLTYDFVLVLSCLLVVAYISNVLWRNYRSQVQIRHNAETRIVHDTEFRAATIGMYLAERLKDLQHASHEPEVLAYFKNKALGMSMKYGLRSSLEQARRYSEDLLNERTPYGQSFFKQILLIASDGQILVQGRKIAADGSLYTDSDTLDKVVYWDSVDRQSVRLAVPIESGGHNVGYMLGWVSADLLFDQWNLIGERNSDKSLEIYNGHERIYPSGQKGEHHHLSIPGDRQAALLKVAHDTLHCSADIPDTPFHLVSSYPVGAIYDDSGPLQQLIGLGAVALALLIGVISFIRFHSRFRLSSAIEKSEETYRSIINNMQDAFYRGDAEGRLVMLSPSAAGMFGYDSVEEMLGKSISEFYADPGGRERFIKSVQEQGGKIHKHDLQMKRKDGTVFPLYVSSVLLFDEEGNYAGIEGVLTDISERKQYEEKLQSRADDLEAAQQKLQISYEQLELSARRSEELAMEARKASQAKTDFLANMSHEIRTPMTAILGFAENLLMDGNIQDAPPERIQALQAIRRNGQHLLEIINDILDMSKIEAGKLEVEQVPCDPLTIISDTRLIMLEKAREKELSFEVDFDGPMPSQITSDPLRIKQILVNLVGNAIKFTRNGGIKLLVSIAKDSSGQSQLKFDVTDTGIGMSPEQMTLLFSPFTQADTSTTRNYGGTGLGLTISRQLATLLGGEIRVHSHEGVGSTFSVTVATGDLHGVPMVDNPERHIQNSKRTPVPESGKLPTLQCRILLAEDGLDNQAIVSSILKKAGAEVEIVVNGKEALDKVLASMHRRRADDPDRPYDIVLMDMQMPVMDGYEATRELRKHNYNGPVIALTAHALNEDRQKCLDAGCNDYATKPIIRKKLLETIARYLTVNPVNS